MTSTSNQTSATFNQPALDSKKTGQKSERQSAQQLVTDKALRTMADAIFKQLQDEGCQAKDIISVSSELLGLVANQITSHDARQ